MQHKQEQNKTKQKLTQKKRCLEVNMNIFYIIGWRNKEENVKKY